MVTQHLQTTTKMERHEPSDAEGGTLVVRPGAVAKVAGMTVREMDGVSLGAMRDFSARFRGAGLGAGAEIRRAVRAGVTVDAEAVVDVAIVVEYGLSIPQVVADVRRQIHDRVLKVTGVPVRRINVEVSDVLLPEHEEPES
jgi:uncharacterized alkaline shock family protein YloU